MGVPEPKSLTILLVEDEPLIALTLVDLIEELGHTTVEAMTAGEALGLFRSRPDVDLLITDIGLPDVSGEVLASQCRALRPSLPVIFATGHSTGGVVVESAQAPTVRLGKPFQIEDLQMAIERITVRP